jgi:tetratricopeptide (TPR) repeat protein
MHAGSVVSRGANSNSIAETTPLISVATAPIMEAGTFGSVQHGGTMHTVNAEQRTPADFLHFAGDLHYRIGQIGQAAAAYTQALTLIRTGQPGAVPALLMKLGAAHAAAAQRADAIALYQEALQIATEQGDTPAQIAAMLALGDLQARAGDTDGASQIAAHMLEIQHTLGDRQMQQMVFEQIACVYEVLGIPDHAITCWQHALALAQQADDRAHAALALTRLQRLCADAGMMHEALNYHEEAMAVNTRALLDDSTLALADYYVSHGEMKTAADLCLQTADHARSAGNALAEMQARGTLGMMYAAMEQHDQAAVMFSHSAEIAQRIGDREHEAWMLAGQGAALSVLGQWKQAVEAYQQAAAAAHEVGNRAAEGHWLAGLALAYGALGQSQKMAQTAGQAVSIARELRDRAAEGEWLELLAEAYVRAAQVPKAVEAYERAVALAKHMGDRRSEAIRLAHLANATAACGGVTESMRLRQQAEGIFKGIGEDPYMLP